jgi:fumarate reductase iron-sulfur subunit
MTQNLEVSVWRGGSDGAFQAFEVPAREHQTVLDVVTHVQRHLDPTLSYRFSCRVGMCGSCAMSVNGIARWTCRTHVKRVAPDGRLEIAPLRNLTVIKDLACDMTDFFEKWALAKGAFVPPAEERQDFAVVPPGSPERLEADRHLECIGCGICYASCDVVQWKPSFLGPAALNRAWTLVNDVRDAGDRERLTAAAGDRGCHACHSQQLCTIRCPMQIDPAGSIAGLKRTIFWAALRGVV